MVVSIVFNFHPYLGKWSNLTNIFEMGWNHQLAMDFLDESHWHEVILKKTSMRKWGEFNGVAMPARHCWPWNFHRFFIKTHPKKISRLQRKPDQIGVFYQMFQENHRIRYLQSLQIWNSYCHKPHFPENLPVRCELFQKSAKSPWVLRHVAEKIGEAPGT